MNYVQIKIQISLTIYWKKKQIQRKIIYLHNFFSQ